MKGNPERFVHKSAIFGSRGNSFDDMKLIALSHEPSRNGQERPPLQTDFEPSWDAGVEIHDAFYTLMSIVFES